jgi:hypothetical protein
MEHEEVRKHSARKEEVALAMCAINHMSYDKPVSSSNAVDRVQQNFPFNPQSYQGVSNSTIATVIFNTGSSIVNASTSSIQFSVNFPNAPSDLVWSWGDITPVNKTVKSGSSACNIFKEITLKARGGEIVERIINSNVLSAALAPFKKGNASEYLYAGAGGASMVTSSGRTVSNFVTETFPVYWAADTNYFEIPLGKLATFFGEQAPLPPTVISGLTLSLQFENFLNAMVFYTASNTRSATGNGASPYTYNTPSAQVLTNVSPIVATPALSLNVANMQLLIDAMTVMDQSLQVLNSKASSLASSGLQYDFYGVYHTQTTLNSSAANIDVLLSAANLQSIVLSFRKAGSPNGTIDNMARLPLVSYADGDAADGVSVFRCDANSVGLLGRGGASIRCRIGSNYLTLTPQFNAAQTYRYTVQALCDVKNSAVSDVDPLHVVNRPFDQAVSYNDWYYGAGATTMAFDCEKSANLSISGAQTNNSRSVILELQGLNASGAFPIVLDIHCLYLNCLNSSLENNILDR